MSWLDDLWNALVSAATAYIQRCIPPYDPAAWNDDNGIQFNNNCYNYGCDTRTDTFAQPGRATGYQITSTASSVAHGAVSDGLAAAGDGGCGCAECRHRAALVFWPPDESGNWDFHWYREGPDGNWTHKPGQTPATNVDNSGQVITDPRTADRGPYTVFVGFFCVNKATIRIA